MRTTWNYLKWAVFFTVLTLAAVSFWAMGAHSSVTSTWLIVVTLAVLEISISFDNAVVNVTVLRGMDPVWKHRFLTWGILIAVFGMRFLFPIAIVSLVSGLNPWAATLLAIEQPEKYSEIMHSVHHQVNAFGGCFLALVALKYFVDHEKEEHWLRPIERRLAQLGRLESTEVGIVLLILLLVTRGLEPAHGFQVLLSGLAGILVWLAVEAVNAILDQGWFSSLSRAGIGGFLYLEVLDASFSFDGVIGALALTNQLVLIAAGLGIGAFYVRSLTMLFLDQGTLQKLRYLESGAFWAVGFLAFLMFAGIHVHIPEIVAGGVSLAILGLAVWSSLKVKPA